MLVVKGIPEIHDIRMIFSSFPYSKLTRPLERHLLDGIIRYYYNEELGTLLESVGLNGEYIAELSGGRIINPGH
jgi:N-acylglucosamine 2-epimerase